jgi:hypothetical protein
MPKVAKELTAIEVKNINESGRHTVGGVVGLYLQVRAPDQKSWLFRFKAGDKRRIMGLGAYPSVTLAQARQKAKELKAKIDSGIDPVAEKLKNKAKLIEEQEWDMFLKEMGHNA